MSVELSYLVGHPYDLTLDSPDPERGTTTVGPTTGTRSEKGMVQSQRSRHFTLQLDLVPIIYPETSQ